MLFGSGQFSEWGRRRRRFLKQRRSKKSFRFPWQSAQGGAKCIRISCLFSSTENPQQRERNIPRGPAALGACKMQAGKKSNINASTAPRSSSPVYYRSGPEKAIFLQNPDPILFCSDENWDQQQNSLTDLLGNTGKASQLVTNWNS